MLDAIPQKKDGEASPKQEEEYIKKVLSLISLISAAVYFNLPLLCEKAFNTLSQSIENIPSLAISVLVAQAEEGSSLPSIKSMAMAYILTHFKQSVKSSLVATLTQSVVEMLLAEQVSRMEEYSLFELVRLWHWLLR